MMQVPGLSAPIPPGAQFGFQPGGWGKAPVNEHGEPLYGDVFGQHMDDDDDLQVCVFLLPHCSDAAGWSQRPNAFVTPRSGCGVPHTCVSCFRACAQ